MPLETAGFARVAGPEPGASATRWLSRVLSGRCSAESSAGRIATGRGRRDRGGAALRAMPATAARGRGLPLSLHRSERHGTRRSSLRGIVHFEDVSPGRGGVNPDLEIGRYLDRHTDYHGFAPVSAPSNTGAAAAEPITLGVLHRYVANQGTAWQFTLDQLSQYFERVAALPRNAGRRRPRSAPLVHAKPRRRDRTCCSRELIGGYLETAASWACAPPSCTSTLAAGTDRPRVRTEPFGRLYQRSLYQSLRNLTGRLVERLSRHRLDPPECGAAARRASSSQTRHASSSGSGPSSSPRFAGQRIRCHGDYHLGQLLFTGKDFVITDFEGDRTPTHRRTAGQTVALPRRRHHGSLIRLCRPERPPGCGRCPRPTARDDPPRGPRGVEPWAEHWYENVAREFVRAYIEAVEPAHLLPRATEAIFSLLELFLLKSHYSRSTPSFSSALTFSRFRCARRSGCSATTRRTPRSAFRAVL